MTVILAGTKSNASRFEGGREGRGACEQCSSWSRGCRHAACSCCNLDVHKTSCRSEERTTRLVVKPEAQLHSFTGDGDGWLFGKESDRRLVVFVCARWRSLLTMYIVVLGSNKTTGNLGPEYHCPQLYGIVLRIVLRTYLHNRMSPTTSFDTCALPLAPCHLRLASRIW